LGKRHIVQILWTVVTNSYLTGFAQGKIYKGSLKSVCMPGLNCYSCPGALGSCPIGAMQSVLGSRSYHFTFYVVGFLMIIGAFFGRFVCGWLCPFGLIQEMLYKIPFFRKISTFPCDRLLRWFKYLVLIIFVILMPMFIVDISGNGAPYFCMLICPAGTLEAGIPLVLANKILRDVIGWLFAWKIVILIFILLLSVLIYRPFCRYLCPLGAVYSVFNPIAFYRIHIDENKCVQCNNCINSCPMNIKVCENPNSLECIRCGACKKDCPSGAITMGLLLNGKDE